MRPTLNALMDAVGCQLWPERWQIIYDDVMTEYEKHSCTMTDPSYIEELSKRYNILTTQCELYKEAAKSIAAQEPLARLLSLLCATLADVDYCDEDLAQFKPFYSSDDAPNLGLNMLTGLALLSQMPTCFENLRKIGLTESEIQSTMQIPEVTVGLFQQRHNGIPGFHLLKWYQRVIKGHLFRVGRLEVEVNVPFQGNACIFRNIRGSSIALAHELVVHRTGMALGAAGFEDDYGSWLAKIQETELYWEGYPFNAQGLVSSEALRLNKSEWKRAVSPGEPVIALHIPAGGRLLPEAVDASLHQIKVFLATYFPHYAYKAFICGSWMVNPKLEKLLGSKSNISMFCNRFSPLTKASSGTSVFNFVFHKRGEIILEELPEESSLQRILKAYYQSGNVLHEMIGYFLETDVQ